MLCCATAPVMDHTLAVLCCSMVPLSTSSVSLRWIGPARGLEGGVPCLHQPVASKTCRSETCRVRRIELSVRPQQRHACYRRRRGAVICSCWYRRGVGDGLRATVDQRSVEEAPFTMITRLVRVRASRSISSTERRAPERRAQFHRCSYAHV